MTPMQLARIKEYQRAYLEEFGEKLDVDIAGMVYRQPIGKKRKELDVRVFDEEIALKKIQEICARNNTTLDNIKGLKYIGRVRNANEYRATREFAHWAEERSYSQVGCSRLLSKDRTSYRTYTL